MNKLIDTLKIIFSGARRLIDATWALCNSTGILWFAAVFFCVSVLILFVWPQAPLYLATDPRSQAAWIRSHTAAFPAGTFTASLGLFSLQQSMWWRFLLFFLGLVFWARLGEAFRIITWARSNRTQVPSLSRVAKKALSEEENIGGDIAAAETAATETLHQCGILASQVAVDDVRYIFAFGPLAGIRSHLLTAAGGLLIVTGLLIGAYFSWAEAPHQLSPGQTWATPHRGFQITLTNLQGTDSSYPTASVTITNSQKAQQKKLVPGSHVIVGGILFSYLSAPSRLHLRALSHSGTPLLIQMVNGQTLTTADLSFPVSGTEENLLLPEAKITLRIVGYSELPAKGFHQPVFLVQAYREDKPLSSLLVTQDQEIPIPPDITLKAKISHDVLVSASHRPGQSALWFGVALFLLGTVSAFIWPLRRCWAQFWLDEQKTHFRFWGEVCYLWHCRPWPISKATTTSKS